MPLAGAIAFVGYREWTESLGPDREWFIQAVQAKTYEVVQTLTADFDGIALPLRYDVQLVLLPPYSNGREYVGRLKNALKPYSPTPVKVTLLCGEVPDVLKRVRMFNGNEDFIEECVNGGEVAVAHADLNYFTRRTCERGPYVTYVEMMGIISEFVNRLKDVAAVQYLGGDNVVAVTSPARLNEVIKVLAGRDGIKVGVGISSRPREAFAKAAEALTRIREGGRRVKYLVIK